MPGKPYHSKLCPFLDFIRKQRTARKSWQAIAEAISAQGTSTSRQEVHAYFRRANRRGFSQPLGFEQPAKKRYPRGWAPRTVHDAMKWDETEAEVAKWSELERHMVHHGHAYAWEVFARHAGELEQTAAVLGVSQMTVSRDLNEPNVSPSVDQPEKTEPAKDPPKDKWAEFRRTREEDDRKYREDRAKRNS